MLQQKRCCSQTHNTTNCRQRAPFLLPDDIYEHSFDELLARATDWSLQKGTTVSGLWSEYIASQDETAQQEGSLIPVSSSPLAEIELLVFRGSTERLLALPPPPEGGLRLDATWRRRVEDQQMGMRKGIQWSDKNCATHTMIELARVLKAYQTEVDQIPLRDRQHLGTMSKMLQELMAKKWANLAQKEIRMLVAPLEEKMRKIMIKSKGLAAYAELERDLPILEVLEIGPESLRQVSFTTLDVVRVKISKFGMFAFTTRSVRRQLYKKPRVQSLDHCTSALRYRAHGKSVSGSTPEI
jgi:hypothetical protein